MSATTARRYEPVAAPFQVVSLTQHWRRIGQDWYRDAIVIVDGRRELLALRDAA